ncbi:hypothetical protein [Azospirillum sp. TSO5]|uniref:hypothetical protein n=1 Tax=Azospirillum sp. TSO5 TaxID=716760 RepID=UPI000D60EC3D|nr:hypothetical protein [Azospirillum sp. TSO5]PWC98007.1 hypothetical protein TSO5_03480 [Azospirillum sp. TSO5]
MTILTLPAISGVAQPRIVRASLERRPLGEAAEWMRDVAAECCRHPTLSRGVVEYLQHRGLVNQCVLLAAEPSGPLCFQFIGVPTMTVMGRAWARQQIGRAVADADDTEFGDAMFASYEEAVESGQPVFNRIALDGLASPLIYTHTLVGWRDDTGRRAVLSCVQL